MTQLPVGKVLSKDAVGDVRPETSVERHLRVWGDFLIKLAAFIVVLGGFIALWYIILSEHAQYEKLRDGAWPVLLTMLGTAGGFLFGRNTAP